MTPIPRALEKMIGRSFLYMANEITIKSITRGKDDDLFVVNSDTGRTLTCTLGELRKEFLPCGPKPIAIEIYRDLDARMPLNHVVEALEDNLAKIKADPGYLPQAKAVNETAKQLIELRKVQVEMVKIAHASRR